MIIIRLENTYKKFEITVILDKFFTFHNKHEEKSSPKSNKIIHFYD